MVGTELLGDRFELLETAGRGGMGTVYRAIDRTTDKFVAVKELLDSGEQSINRFLHEARVLGEIEHPHVVRYLTHGVGAGGKPFLVMDWLDGTNLAQRLTKEPLSIQETVDLGRRVASALGLANARGIVHRDVKPSNIFLPGGDVQQLKLLDFGIARHETVSTTLTKSGMLVGTLGYMAPEQAKGERTTLDARADVFSLGCVLFECLTGRPAFQAGHVLALLAKLLMDEPPRVRELRPDVPPALDDLIVRMLSKEPENRPANGNAVAAALHGINAWEIIGPPQITLPPGSLTHVEKRLVSVVVVVPPTTGTPSTETAGAQEENPSTLRIPGKRLFEVRRAVQAFGAKFEEIANGMLIALLVGTGPATDQVAVAARCALSMHWLLPECSIVLLTRRGESTGRLPVGEVFEQAASMLGKVDAAELERMILIDEVTQALLDVRFDVGDENGRFVLRAERNVGANARTLLGKPSPFVGRDRELRHLLEMVNDAVEEQCALVVLVSADAGIGKSRLRFEFTQRLRSSHPDLNIVTGRGDSISAGSAFSLIGSAFRSSLGVALDEPLESRRAKLSALVSRYFAGEDHWRITGFLGEMIGIPFADENDPRVRAARQNPAIMADQIQSAYVDFMRAVVASTPLLLVLEDLQWGDSPSIRLIDAALRELSDRPFMVVAFSRHGVQDVFPKLWAGRPMQTMVLSGLSRRSAESLVKAVLGENVESATMARIVERAAGNAFFLEELIRAVSEGRGETLPETVLGMVEARIATLNAHARRMLRAASIFGETFWERALDDVLQDDRSSDGKAHLEQLCQLELIARRPSSRFLGETEYGFRHALVREAAYAMLTEHDRALGHDRAGEWLVRAGEQDSMALAGHFERGPFPAKAAIHYARAAEQAMCGADLYTAIARAERGVACGAKGEANVALRYVLSASCTLTAEYTKAYENSRMLLADTSLRGLSRARAIGYSISSAIFLGKVDVFGGLIAEILGIVPGPEEVAVVAHALMMAIITLILAGHRNEATPSLRRLDELAVMHPGDLLTVAWQHIARMHWARENDDELWKALEHNRAGVSLFEHVGARQNLAIYNAHLGLSHLQLGSFLEAEIVLDRVLATHDASNLARMYAMHYKCGLLFDTGRLDEAFALATTLFKDSLAANDFVLLWCARLYTVAIFIARDKLDAADRVLDELGEKNAFLPFLRARFLSLRSEVRRLQGQTEEALRLASESMDAGRKGPRYNYCEDPLSLHYALALHAARDFDNARRAIREARNDLLACAERIPDEIVRRAYLENIGWHAQTLALAREWLKD